MLTHFWFNRTIYKKPYMCVGLCTPLKNSMSSKNSKNMSGIYDALQKVKQKKERESSTKHPDNVEKAKREQAFFDRLLQKMKEKKERESSAKYYPDNVEEKAKREHALKNLERKPPVRTTKINVSNLLDELQKVNQKTERESSSPTKDADHMNEMAKRDQAVHALKNLEGKSPEWTTGTRGAGQSSRNPNVLDTLQKVNQDTEPESSSPTKHADHMNEMAKREHALKNLEGKPPEYTTGIRGTGQSSRNPFLGFSQGLATFLKI